MFLCKDIKFGIPQKSLRNYRFGSVANNTDYYTAALSRQFDKVELRNDNDITFFLVEEKIENSTHFTMFTDVLGFDSIGSSNQGGAKERISGQSHRFTTFLMKDGLPYQKEK